jgi:Toprim domain-containing protein
MTSPAAALAIRLAQEAEAVCRCYLSNGRRHGRYWLAGDVHNSKGRSLYVCLSGSTAGRGAAGNWTDGATGEYGDLLDLIRLNRGFDSLRATLDEARIFLRLPRPVPQTHQPPAPGGSPEAARRLWACSQPIAGTLAEVYLRARGIANATDLPALRFHPACWYRPDGEASSQIWPALIAAITDEDGAVTGIQRTWLSRDGRDKAPLATPRRALGHLLGNGVRFGLARDALAAAEGVETMLALRMALPGLPMIAATSAGHLAALSFPPGLRRLILARDNDAAGRAAMRRLTDRATAAGIGVQVLNPATNDFNTDLTRLGIAALRARMARQLAPDDISRFAAL